MLASLKYKKKMKKDRESFQPLFTFQNLIHVPTTIVTERSADYLTLTHMDVAKAQRHKTTPNVNNSLIPISKQPEQTKDNKTPHEGCFVMSASPK